MRESPVADLCVVLGGVAVAGVALAVSGSFPHRAADPAGLAVWPRTLAAIIIAAACGIVLDPLRRLRREGWPARATGRLPARPMGRVAVCAGACVIYALLVSVAGFLLPSFLFVAALMLFFGAKVWEAAIYAAILAGLLHVFFFTALGATPPAPDLLMGLLGLRD